MKRILLRFVILSSALFSSFIVHAQSVGINGTGSAPNPSAMLDVSSTSSGILIPRMIETQRNAIASPATGLLIYQTNDTTGFYYYTGTMWQLIGGGGTTGWALTGNSGTIPGTNFIGTTDANDFVFKTNSNEKMRLVNSSGNLILGSGDGTGTVAGNTLRSPNGAGTNISGANLTIASGNGTGIGGSGYVSIQTAPMGSAGATANTLTEALRIANTGNIIIGSGEGGIAPEGNTLRAPNGSGTNITGADITITSGNGTGTGGSGHIIFQTAPAITTGTAVDTMVERMRISSTGNIGIGTTNPLSLLHVNGTETLGTPGGGTTPSTGTLIFNNSSSANSVSIAAGNTTASYSITLPTAQGSANTVLTNNGSGALTWTTPNSTIATSNVMTSTSGVTIVNGTGQVVGSSNLAINIAANSSSTQGLVPAGSGNNNRAWLTDGSGNPAWRAVDLTSAVTNILPIANGGTNLSTTPTNGQLLIGNGTGYTLGTIAAGTGMSVTNGSGSITVTNTGVTSVGLSLPGIFTVSGSPVTTTGTLTGTLANENANTVFAGPTSGGAATPTFRALVAADVPAGSVTANNGLTVSSGNNVQLGGTNPLIGNTTIISGGYNLAFTGTGVLQLGAGSSSTGTLQFLNSTNNKAVGISAGATTTAYNLTLPLAQGAANTVLTNNGSGTLTWALPSANLSNLTPGTGLTGSAYNGSAAETFGVSYGSTGGTAVQGNTTLTINPGTGMSGGGTITLGTGGTVTLNNTGVTSVGLSLPGIFTVSGSPVTTTGTLTGALANENANTVFAGPTTGVAATPTFRALVAADIPAGSVTANNGLTISGGNNVQLGGTLSAATTIASAGNNLSFTGTGSLQLGAGSASTGTLKFYNSTNANAVGISAGATTTAYNLTLPLAQGAANTVLTNNGSGTLTWALPSANLLNLTPGTGLTGSAYNGSAAETFAVSYGSAAGTAVQGNTTLTINPGTGISGGGTITLGTGGTVTLNNTGVTAVTASAPLASSGGTTPNISLTGIVPIANGGTDLSTTPTDGQLLIGNGTNYTLGTLTAGTGMSITNAAGSITLNSTGVTTANNGLTISAGNNVQLGGPNPLIGNTSIISGGYNLAFTGTGVLQLGAGSSSTGTLQFLNSTNNNVIGIIAGATTATYSVTLPLAQGAANTVLTNNGSGTLTWTLPSANLSTLTPGTGLTGSAYNGSAAETFGVSYGSTGGTAVQGNTTLTINPGTGMSGGGTITLGTGGTVTLNNTGVTSVGLSLPGIFTVSGSPVTTTGTLTGTLATETANTVFAGPTSGGAAAPTFRALVAADVPAGSVTANNGLTVNTGNNVQLGGSLIQNTTITQGNYNLISNLTGTGNFEVQESGVNDLVVNGSTGYVGIGTGGPTQPLFVTQTNNANKYVTSSNAIQLSQGTDYQNVAVYGYAEGANNSWGYAIGVMGIIHPVSHGGTALYGGVNTSAPTFATANDFYGIYTDASGVVSGTGYAAAFMNGNVGIGTATPASLLQVNGTETLGTASSATGTLIFDNSSSANSVSISAGNTTTAYSLTLPTAQGANNTVLTNNGSGTLTWALPSANLLNLTPGTGLTGSAYNGSAAETFAVSYGSAAGTAVQGNTTLTISPGTGMSGGGTITLGTGGTLTLNNTGVTAVTASAPLASSGGTTPNISLTGIVPIANGGTDLSTTPTNGQLLIGNGTNYTLGTLTAGTGMSITNAAGSITLNNTGVTSVGLSLPGIFTVSGSPVTTTGTLTGALANENANTVFAGPTTGVAATPTFRALVAADIPAGSVTANNGLTISGGNNVQLGGTLSAATTIASAGNNLSFTGTGAFQLGAASASTGTLKFYNSTNANAVGISAGATTTAYNLTLPLAQGAANTVLTNNGSGTLTWALPSANLLNLTPGTGLTGSAYNGSAAETFAVSYGSVAGTAVQGNTTLTINPGTGMSGGGTITLGTGGTLTLNNTGVTSVGLALPSIFTVSGSPVTTTGTLTGTFTTETANTVFAGPTTGVAATPTFRALVAADIPAGVVTANNGLTVNTGNNVQLGGTLAAATTIASGGFNLSFTGTGAFQLGAGSASTGTLKFYNSTNANAIGISAGATTTAYNLTLPLAQGAANTVLTNNGSGVLTWAAPTSSAWNLTGNANTTPGTNFIGTTDAQDLMFEVNSVEKMRIDESSGNVVIGAGEGSGAVTANTLRGPDPVGTNIAGVDLTIAGGGGTGNGGGGDVVFQTAPAAASGATANTLAERMRIMYTGNVGIGTATPTSLLQVNGTETLGKASTTTGTLTYNNSTNANTVSISSGTTSTSYSLTLPTAAPTSSGQVLSSTTAGVMSWSSPSGQLKGIICDTTSGTTTATLAAGTTMLVVKVLGGGGAGGGIGSGGTVYADQAGSGGGAGGYDEGFVSGVTVGTTTVTMVVGAGGTGASGTNGTAAASGTASTVTVASPAATFTGNGGVGGKTIEENTGGASLNQAGGAGGSASNGSIAIQGANGGNAIISITGNDVVFAGEGGCSIFGNGGQQQYTRDDIEYAGLSARSPGAGGGGAVAVQQSSNTPTNGGNGGHGIIIIYEY